VVRHLPFLRSWASEAAGCRIEKETRNLAWRANGVLVRALFPIRWAVLGIGVGAIARGVRVVVLYRDEVLVAVLTWYSG